MGDGVGEGVCFDQGCEACARLCAEAFAVVDADEEIGLCWIKDDACGGDWPREWTGSGFVDPGHELVFCPEFSLKSEERLVSRQLLGRGGFRL